MPDDRYRAAPHKPPTPARIEKVKAVCGHMVDFPVFDDRKDQRFREQRRAKATSRPCAACRQQRYQERLVQEEQARQEKARKAAERAALPPAQRPAKKARASGRLPNGATFHVSFDAAKGEWSGTLTVPDKGEVKSAATGVFRLLEMLDEQYRKANPET